MSNQVLVKKTNGEQHFMDIEGFTRVQVLDKAETKANVYIEGKLIGAIFDSDINRMRHAKKEIVLQDIVD